LVQEAQEPEIVEAPPPPEAAIEVRNLTKRYGSVNAIDEVSFTVHKGEIVGFLGPNGAGKSTTMRIISALSPATSGEASIFGESVARHPQRIKSMIGYMPEHNPLPEDMRVNEYLSMRARLKNVPSRKIKSRVDEVMEICDLQRKARRRIIATLSKGYRQRVGIADAIVSNPKLIIMDEPTIGLDPHQILSIRRLIDSLRGKMTVILSSHILPEIEKACDRVIIINQGRVVASGSSMALRHEFIKHTSWRVTVLSERMADLERVLNTVAKDAHILTRKKNENPDYRTLTIRTSIEHGLGNLLMTHMNAIDPNALREIAHIQPNLEDIFMAATRKSWKDTSVPFNLAKAKESKK